MHDDDRSRHILPIPDVLPVSLTTFDARDPTTRFRPIRPVRSPAGAPNVLVILLDDVGLGASSAFGGPCNTPNAERLAAGGLKYTRFHTTALCSPTRAALIATRMTTRPIDTVSSERIWAAKALSPISSQRIGS